MAEFRSGTFTGYRYLRAGWPLTTPGSPRRPSPKEPQGPHLATAKGISLGSTLGQVRSAYDGLRFIGVDKWRAPNGVVFVVNAAREPEPLSSKVVRGQVRDLWRLLTGSADATLPTTTPSSRLGFVAALGVSRQAARRL